MDKAERKRLKKLSKEIQQRRDEDFVAVMAAVNPAPFGTEQFAANEREIKRKERLLYPRSEVIDPEFARANFLVRPVEYDLSDPLVGLGRQQFWECHACRQLVPANPTTPLRCQCGNVYVEPIKTTAVNDGNGNFTSVRLSTLKVRSPSSIQLVELIGTSQPLTSPPGRTAVIQSLNSMQACPTPRKWWQFWKRP